MINHNRLIITLLLFSVSNLIAQNISIKYDQSGNRIQFGESNTPRIATEPDSILLAFNDTTGFTIVENAGNGTLSWTASTDTDWITVLTSAGNEGDSLFIEAQKNDLREARAGQITINGEGEFVFPISVVVTQEAKPNSLPLLAASIPDVFVIPGFATKTISSLNDFFTDPDLDTLSYSVDISNASVISASIINDTTLTLSEVGEGFSDVYITANDPFGGTVTDTFRVEVTNDAVIAVESDTLYLPSDAGDTSFTFTNEGNATMNWTLASQVSWVTLTSSVSGVNDGSVGFSFTANQDASIRTGNILIISSEAVNSPYTVVLIQEPRVNTPPELIASVSDYQVKKGFNEISIDLDTVFNDIDGDQLFYGISTDNQALLETDIVDGILTLTETVNTGSGQYTITASDNIDEVNAVFNVTVVSNASPQLTRSIPDLFLLANFDPVNLDLSGYFSDPDDPELTYSTRLSGDLNINAEVTDALLTIRYLGLGITTVEVTASDGLNDRITSFEITVEEEITGLEEANVSIYPNPSQGAFTIDLKEQIVEQIFIIDANGKLVKQYDGKRTMVEVSTLVPGNYTILFQHDDQHYTSKNIVILK